MRYRIEGTLSDPEHFKAIVEVKTGTVVAETLAEFAPWLCMLLEAGPPPFSFRPPQSPRLTTL